MFKIGGYRPSTGEINCKKFSSKSDKFTKLAASVDNSIHIIPEFTPISNQQAISSCVSNATSDCAEMLKGLESPAKVEQVSRLFIYYNARVFQNEANIDNGCYIHDALATTVKLGLCRESVWEYDTNKVFVRPSLEAYREASDNKSIVDYYQITSDGDQRLTDIEMAIRSNHPVIFGTPVGQELADYRGEDKVFNPPTKEIGGHAMLITGVRVNNGKKEFLIRNSWGENWGIKGHCWFSADYITWSKTNDLFVATHMTDFLV